jgi:Na+/H+ antiporter NhaC
LPEFVRTIPEMVHEMLRAKMHATTERVMAFNREVTIKWRRWRTFFLLYTLVPWFVLSIVLVLILLGQRVGVNASFLWGIFTFLAGAGGVAVYIQRRYQGFKQEFKSMDEAAAIRNDSQDVAKLMNELQAGLVRMVWHKDDQTE